MQDCFFTLGKAHGSRHYQNRAASSAGPYFGNAPHPLLCFALIAQSNSVVRVFYSSYCNTNGYLRGGGGVRKRGATSNLQKTYAFSWVPYARIYCFPTHRYLVKGNLPQATSQTCFQHKCLTDAVLLLVVVVVVVVVVMLI
jgi:hypothetical protein